MHRFTTLLNWGKSWSMPWFLSSFCGNAEFSGNGNFDGDDECASNYCMHCPAAGEKAELKK